MESTTKISNETSKLIDSIVKSAADRAKEKIAIASKTDDELAEEFIKERKLIRPIEIPIPNKNPFTENTLARLEIAGEAIQLLPDGPIKNQVYFLFNLANEAAICLQATEHSAIQWRSKCDAFLVELLKHTVIKANKRATGGAFGRIT